MKAIIAIVVVATAALLPPALACQSPPGTTMAQLVAADRKDQVRGILELAESADGIALATAVAVDPQQGRATFRIDRLIKGEAPASLPLGWSTNTIYVGCSTSAFFRQIRLSTGQRYLIYFKGGELLRAGGKRRAPLELSLRQELRLVSPGPAPNNSSKPTPLRGAA